MLFLLGAMVAATGAAAANQKPANDDDSKVICRRSSIVGTRVAARICHTRAEWRMIDEENRDGGRERVDRSIRETRSDPWPGPVPK
jgi:hypothetical protein